ncbi:Mobile element protein [Frigoriglobus tundricola]|uniref:Mobile element protein n=1 Tax=Frigoriglobus tundricola TaxID=2774151 RepID=A0A6M5YYM2_9BACT|nr:Mobile element protein [Frigoriglobus tundricola]
MVGGIRSCSRRVPSCPTRLPAPELTPPRPGAGLSVSSALPPAITPWPRFAPLKACRGPTSTCGGDASHNRLEPTDCCAHPRRTTSRPRGPHRVGPAIRHRPAPPRRRPTGVHRRDPARAGGATVLTVPPTTKLWFASAVDLRLGFDGLANLVRTQLSADPLSGHCSCSPTAWPTGSRFCTGGRSRVVPVVPATGSRALPLPRSHPDRDRAVRRPVRYDPRRHRRVSRSTLQALFSRSDALSR